MATLNAKFKRKNGTTEDILHFETSWTKVLNKPSTFTPTAHTHSATDITSGILGTARLGTGTASASTFLRGDNTWAAPTVSWGAITSKPTFAAVATSGSYNDLANKPTIPTVPSVMTTTEGNTGTATTQRTINAANLKSIILNHSPAGARPASDVSSWAKAASKPSYSYTEVGAAASSHGHNFTTTYLGERTSLGTSTIAAIANYTLFYVTFRVEWGDGIRYDSSIVIPNAGHTSTMVYDINNHAPVMINAHISGNSFVVTDDGVMPYSMLTGASLLQVSLYGVTIQ